MALSVLKCNENILIDHLHKESQSAG